MTLRSKIESRLVWNAWEWKKWWSMRFTIISAFFSSLTIAWIALPGDWTADFPGWLKVSFAIGALTTSVAAGVSRVLQQTNTTQA